MKTFDTVRVIAPVCNHRVEVGAVGTVVGIFEHPTRAYEVEFTDEQGRTIASLAIEPQMLELVEPHLSE